MKKTFYIGNRITTDTLKVQAETWYEAMNEAYWRWGCKISRHDMINLTKTPKPCTPSFS